MKRRDAVKGIILFSLGTGIIYSCSDKYKAIRELALNHFEPKNEELDLLEKLSLAIVPIHLIPDLVDHTSLPLMFTMLDNVYEAKDQAVFQAGYQNFSQFTESLVGKRFEKMSQEERTDLLIRFNEKEEGIDPAMQKFYDMVKTESIRYLKTSEYYQRKINYYEMAPGRYRGDVLISELKNANEV